MNYIEVKKKSLKYLDIATAYVETVNWAYVGAGIFSVLLIFYIYDSMIGTQTSPWLIVGIVTFLFVLGAIGFSIVNGMK